MKKQTKNSKEKEIRESIVKSLLEIAKSPSKDIGAIVILGEYNSYKRLKKKKNIKPFYILKDLDLFKSLSSLDGATIINTDGLLKNYSVMILSHKVLKGYGTRNSAAISASSSKGVKEVFLASASEKKVKIFKKGKLILQLDALQPGIEKQVNEIDYMLESAVIGTVGSAGMGVLLPAMGIGLALPFAPGILIFGTVAYVTKKLVDLAKSKKKKW